MAKRSEAGKTAKADEPWTDKERFLIVQHVLSTANLGNLYDALSDTLVKEGCPVRKKIAVSLGSDRVAQHPVARHRIFVQLGPLTKLERCCFSLACTFVALLHLNPFSTQTSGAERS